MNNYSVEELRKAMIKEVDDTIEYYKTRPRAVTSEGGCKYYDKDSGFKCAIGRHMSEDQICLIKSGRENFGSDCKVGDLSANLLPPNLIKFSMKFLNKLQLMHDDDYLWILNSSGGANFISSDWLDNFKIRINLGAYDNK